MKGHTGGNECKTNCGVGLAVGQDSFLLRQTRLSNAGIGNGGEFWIQPPGKKKSSEIRDLDPGNSGAHNRAGTAPLDGPNHCVPEIEKCWDGDTGGTL